MSAHPQKTKHDLHLKLKILRQASTTKRVWSRDKSGNTQTFWLPSPSDAWLITLGKRCSSAPGAKSVPRLLVSNALRPLEQVRRGRIVWVDGQSFALALGSWLRSGSEWFGLLVRCSIV